ncbi:MAG: DUF2911 domain-containing protein [Pyrinomonadaceae bacterium]
MFRCKVACISSVVLFFTILLLAEFVAAQVKLPVESPRASVMYMIGITRVTINYGRPAVKGRKVWGDPVDTGRGEKTADAPAARLPGMGMVISGRVWRTGANEATQFAVTDDVLINGHPLAAGRYSLHTIPGKDEWIVIFNKTADQWGSFSYDAKEDALRVKTKPEWLTDNSEWLTFAIDPVTENSAAVTLRWEKARVRFTVSIKDLVATTLANARKTIAEAEENDWLTPYQAATYAKANKVNAEAVKWFELSLKAANEQIKDWENFKNLSNKANSLFELGRIQEGLATAAKAIEKGKAEKANTAAFEKRVADIKAGKN